MGGQIIMKHALAFALVFTTVCAIVAASKNQDDDDGGGGIYDGAMKWAASVGPFSHGHGRSHLSSDLFYDSTGKAIGKAKDTCHAVNEEAGQVTAHLTKQAVGKVKDKAVLAGYKVPKKEGKGMMKKVKEVRDIATTLGHDISGNVTRAIEGGGLGSVVNLFATASAFGEGLWVTVIWGPSLRTNLPRQQLEMVETKMSKLYFKSMSSSIAMALLGHCLSLRNTDTLQSFNLLASLLMVLLNLGLIRPLSQTVMHQRNKLEKEGERPQESASSEVMEALNDRTKRLDLYSSSLNAMSLSALAWHLYYLCHRLSATT